MTKEQRGKEGGGIREMESAEKQAKENKNEISLPRLARERSIKHLHYHSNQSLTIHHSIQILVSSKQDNPKIKRKDQRVYKNK